MAQRQGTVYQANLLQCFISYYCRNNCKKLVADLFTKLKPVCHSWSAGGYWMEFLNGGKETSYLVFQRKGWAAEQRETPHFIHISSQWTKRSRIHNHMEKAVILVRTINPHNTVVFGQSINDWLINLQLGNKQSKSKIHPILMNFLNKDKEEHQIAGRYQKCVLRRARKSKCHESKMPLWPPSHFTSNEEKSEQVIISKFVLAWTSAIGTFLIAVSTDDQKIPSCIPMVSSGQRAF